MVETKHMTFAVIVHLAEEGGYWAEVPSLPGCVSQGETLEETLANVREAIELFVETMIEDSEPVPLCSEQVREVTIAVSVPA